jgi:hypothetical protein
MRRVIAELAVVAATGALACSMLACGGTTSAADTTPPADRAPSQGELRRLQQRMNGPVFWLGRTFSGAALSAAEESTGSQLGVSLSYGPPVCAGDSGCTFELEVDTTATRGPYSHEQSCWQRVGPAWLDWCEGYENGDLYVGGSQVNIFSVDFTPEEVARAIRPFPRRDTAKLPTARRFSCREASALPRRFVRSLPGSLRPRGC